MQSASASRATAPAGLISHAADPWQSDGELMQAACARLQAAGDLPGATVAQQLALLEELSGFPLGRFLAHRGLNAWWTHKAVTWDAHSAAPMGALERRIIADLPATRATRERFGIFQRELQALLRPGMTLASVPCGLMGELLLLGYSAAPGGSLVGVDLDQQALDAAQALAAERGLAGQVTLRCQDAWAEPWTNKVDVLTSNGLNIYEADDARVTELYRSFHAALRPGGTLVTSFMTPPPTLSPQSPWKMDRIDPQALALQFLLFVRIIEVKWSAFRTHEQTRAQLEQAGFTDIRFIDDHAGLFPTVLALKPDPGA